MVRYFKSPVNVSPLIRFTRWYFLLAGVACGAYTQNALQHLEVKKRRCHQQMQKQQEVSTMVFEEERTSSGKYNHNGHEVN
ncbi:hypothetical protein ACI65C_012856 [Semiaphis heraclei]